MERTDNYRIQAAQAKARFLTYDQQTLISKFRLKHDEYYLYPTFLGEACRLDRRTGDLERLHRGVWTDANSHGEIMTLLDLLCDSREDRYVTGRWKNLQSFGLQFHQNLLEDRRNPWADRFDRNPESLHRACRRLGGIPVPGADISYSIVVFEDLPVCIRFWHGDDEFAPRLRYLWDENADRYLKYETMHYAIPLLLRRLGEEAS